MISCALNNASVFGDDCRLERDAGGLLVIHNPDGSFLRLRMKPGGAVVTEDGFLQASAHSAPGGGVAVDVGDDHYVIPRPSADDPQASAPSDAPLADAPSADAPLEPASGSASGSGPGSGSYLGNSASQ